MRILVDADSCPVKESIVEIAKAHKLEVIMFFDTSHIYHDGYSQVIYIDKGRDGVDFALVNSLKSGDLVITQDYGVATMALSKNALAMNQNGLIYTNDNIEQLLNHRYLHQKLRKAKERVKGPKKRTVQQDDAFEKQLLYLIDRSGNYESNN